MNYNAQQIYDLLRPNLLEQIGYIDFNLMNISIRINDKSSIGYLFQEWLKEWMIKSNINFRIKDNSQEFPDFMLNLSSDEKDLLEVKLFDYEKSPNFDIANFEAYCRSLKIHPYRIDADYLIFAYTLRDSTLIIKDMWLKKIWEITCASERFPLRLQVKQDTIYNIRPAIWYSEHTKNKPFNNKELFIEALYKTLLQYEKTKINSINWLSEFNAISLQNN